MMMLAMVLSCSAMTAVTQAATTHTASATTDRKDGVCTYTVKGLDPSRESEFTMELRRSDNKKTMIKKQITINEDNCVKGTYEGNITLADAKYICTSYSVHILVGTEDIKAGVCDFSIHRSRMRMLITGKSTDSARTFQLVSTEQMCIRDSANIIRPLLCLDRQQIEQIVRGNGDGWREDATNREEKYTRNKIRNRVFPCLLYTSFLCKLCYNEPCGVRQSADEAGFLNCRKKRRNDYAEQVYEKSSCVYPCTGNDVIF